MTAKHLASIYASRDVYMSTTWHAKTCQSIESRDLQDRGKQTVPSKACTTPCSPALTSVGAMVNIAMLSMVSCMQERCAACAYSAHPIGPAEECQVSRPPYKQENRSVTAHALSAAGWSAAVTSRLVSCCHDSTVKCSNSTKDNTLRTWPGRHHCGVNVHKTVTVFTTTQSFFNLPHCITYAVELLTASGVPFTQGHDNCALLAAAVVTT